MISIDIVLLMVIVYCVGIVYFWKRLYHAYAYGEKKLDLANKIVGHYICITASLIWPITYIVIVITNFISKEK